MAHVIGTHSVVVNILPPANEIGGTLCFRMCLSVILSMGGISGTRSILGGVFLVPGPFWEGISGTRSILGVSLVPGLFWGYLWYKVLSGGGEGHVQGMGTAKGLVCLGRGYVQGWGRSGIYEILSASGRYASHWNDGTCCQKNWRIPGWN